ncbi:MAG TPA: hypothetical protein VFO16_15005 [Pseudonocardiaceae bacterium]|nr:hypothetical protein [Pseudonocardiaceae bacterium]
MPIRTHRGRAAVYRKFWGWPVRSPRHLAGAVLLVVALTAGISLALPGSHRHGGAHRMHPGGPRVSAASPAPRPAFADPGDGRVPRPVTLTPSAPAPAAALAAASSWVNAFLSVPKGVAAAGWAEQLRPYTTDDLFPELRTIDPANVPVAQIIEAPRTVSVSGSSAEVDVPTSAMVMRLLVVSTPAGWRVASYERAG